MKGLVRLLGFLVLTESRGTGVVCESSLVILFDFGELGHEDEVLLPFSRDLGIELVFKIADGRWTEDGEVCGICALFAVGICVVRLGGRHRGTWKAVACRLWRKERWLWL